jgi:2-hydroxy-3-oxopropionate reductase
MERMISLLGLGPMGAPMARRLIERGDDVTVWNRTASVAEAFADSARVASSVADAAAEITLTVLPDLPQVEALLPALREGWTARTITQPVLVVHGTVSPVAVAALAERLAHEGITVIDAPLSGGTIGATEGRLSVMVGGDRATAERLMPVFAAFGTTVRYLGRSGSGALAKLCNQVVVASTVAAIAEATVLARSGGLDLETVFELLGGGLANSEVLRQKGSRYIDSDFVGGGSAKNQVKDLRFVASSGIPLPLTAAVTELFETMVDDGDGALDHTGVVATIERLAARA